MTDAPPSPVWKATLLQAGALAIAALLPAWATAHFHWNWGPAPEFQSTPAHKILAEPAKYILVDVRSAERFAQRHAPGARLFSEATYQQDLDNLRTALTPELQVIVFGEGVGSDRATRIARQLRRDLAPTPVHLLEGGWAAWPREENP